jgi:hypothetical protein
MVISIIPIPTITPYAAPTVTLAVAAEEGIAPSVIRSDAVLASFDAVAPTTQGYGDVAAPGVIAFGARRDHLHGMPSEGRGVIWIQEFQLDGVGVLSSNRDDYGLSDVGDLGGDGTIRCTTVIPSDFLTLDKAVIILNAAATGTWRLAFHTDFGADGESYLANSDSIAAYDQAATSGILHEIDISAALTAIAAGDYVGFKLIRSGSHASDDLNQCFVLGLLLEFSR